MKNDKRLLTENDILIMLLLYNTVFASIWDAT